MAKVKTIELSKEERNILAGIMRTKEVTHKDLVKLIGIPQPTFNHALMGHVSMKVDLAKKIYQALGADPSLDSLINYGVIAPRGQPESTGWSRIYEEGLQTLKEVYDNQTPERKGAIIGELEKLAEKYKGE